MYDNQFIKKTFLPAVISSIVGIAFLFLSAEIQDILTRRIFQFSYLILFLIILVFLLLKSKREDLFKKVSWISLFTLIGFLIFYLVVGRK
jgi:hypothetical protein